MRLAWAAAQYRFQPLTSNFQFTDHQGNVRMTFTSKDEVESPVATMETANEATERGNFLKYDDARRVYSTIFDRTNGASPGYAMRLSGVATEKMGLARSLAVVPGDKLKMEVFAKYFAASNNDMTAYAAWVASMVSGASVAASVIDGSGYANNTGTTVPYSNPLNKTSETGPAPKAYLNWLVFDRDFNPIIDKCGYRRVTTLALQTAGADGLHEKVESPEVVIAEAGFVYIWLSNENATPVEVYFDDFKVMHTKSPVIQSNDQYSFGSNIGAFSYQRENSTQNKFLYNAGSELQTDIASDLYGTFFRGYDASIGRFMQVDLMAGRYSNHTPYNFGFNDPIYFNDPFGDEPPPKKNRVREEVDQKIIDRMFDDQRRMYGVIGDDDLNGTGWSSAFDKYGPGDGGALQQTASAFFESNDRIDAFKDYNKGIHMESFEEWYARNGDPFIQRKQKRTLAEKASDFVDPAGLLVDGVYLSAFNKPGTLMKMQSGQNLIFYDQRIIDILKNTKAANQAITIGSVLGKTGTFLGYSGIALTGIQVAQGTKNPVTGLMDSFMGFVGIAEPGAGTVVSVFYFTMTQNTSAPRIERDPTIIRMDNTYVAPTYKLQIIK